MWCTLHGFPHAVPDPLFVLRSSPHCCCTVFFFDSSSDVLASLGLLGRSATVGGCWLCVWCTLLLEQLLLLQLLEGCAPLIECGMCEGVSSRVQLSHELPHARPWLVWALLRFASNNACMHERTYNHEAPVWCGGTPL